MAQRNFERVNLDLMYALPGQSLAQAEADIATAIGAGVGHVSAYHLTLEPNTPFHHAPPPLPDDELAADMQEMVEDRLAGAGFGHYETSAFARGTDQRCRHNLNYWSFGDYLGIGAGAHGKLSNHETIWREARHRHPRAYLGGARARRFHQHPAGRGPRRPARRIHDECPAPQRRLPAGAVHRAHRPAAFRHRKVGAGGTARGLAGDRGWAASSDEAGPALPQPAAGGVPRLGFEGRHCPSGANRPWNSSATPADCASLCPSDTAGRCSGKPTPAQWSPDSACRRLPAGIGSDQDRYFSAAFSTTVRGFPLSTISVLTNRAGVLPTFLK
jgi:hypothetical protein